MRKVINIVILIILTSTSLKAQWIIQSPLPTNSYLNSVQFLNQNTGYAGGSGGKIIKTTNGGINWFDINTNINPFGGMLSVIFSISFIDTDTGYAVTNNKIIKTTNAGINWFTLDSGNYSKLRYIHFIDANTGYAGGKYNIIKTTNGGINWILQSSLTSVNIVSGFFLNSSTGFFAGSNGVAGRILKTTNGGDNWNMYSVYSASFDIYNINTVYFIDEFTGFVAGNGGRFGKTTNGGINWVQRQALISNVNYIKFFNEQTGIAVGDNLFSRTTNSGNTWLNQSLGYGNVLYWGSFMDSDSAYFVGKYGLVVKTTNSGINFSITSSGTYRDLHSIHFINSKTGFAAGDYGAIVKTTNSGLNWFSLNTTSAANVFQSIFFTDSLNGIVCDWDGVIWKTTDGGTNWETQFLGMGLFDIDFVNSNTGYISGSGCIVKTTNGGTNWVGQDPGIPVEFRSIFFLDENTGYSGGKYGNLIKTTNGGINWISLNSGSSQIISSIYFVNQNTGYALTCNSLLKTTNAGSNWFVNLPGIIDCLEGGIEFADENTGYAVGGQQANYSLIYKTTNGGINWKQQDAGVKYQLYSLSVINADTVFTAGWDGTILRTINGGGTVGINSNNSEIPENHYLSQNYPNPFNPETNIQFDLPKEGLVSLKVYDILGREVKNLVNEFKQAGRYIISFDGSDLSSGIYFYRIQVLDPTGRTGDFVQVKRMILLK